MKIKNISWKIIVYCALAIVLALATILILDYLSYFFHELGHASSAVLHAFTKNQTSLAINFTYIDFRIPYTNITTLVPQQTFAQLPNIMLFYGVLFEIIFYGFILFALSMIKRIKQSKRLELSVSFAFITLIVRDVLNNLICGTDGLQIPCSSEFLVASGAIFYLFLLFFIGYFYSELLLYKYLPMKIADKKQPPLKSKYLKFTQLEYDEKDANELVSDLKRFLVETKKALARNKKLQPKNKK